MILLVVLFAFIPVLNWQASIILFFLCTSSAFVSYIRFIHSIQLLSRSRTASVLYCFTAFIFKIIFFLVVDAL